MNILHVASEVVPFAKTGGLADVAGALPKEIQRLGHSCAVVMPCYRSVREGGTRLQPTGKRVRVPLGEKEAAADILAGTFPGTKVPVYFLDAPAYFDRPALYNDAQGDYLDNAERFTFLARGALEAALALNLRPDVIHAHDWQTALLPVYLKTLYRDALPKTRSTLTVHNLAYQGVFWHWDMKLTGLDWSLFNMEALEFYGKMNFLKGGIVFADAITTVSPTYAEEVLTLEFGCGLEGVLKDRKADLFGILNGIEDDVWNPEIDRLIPARYGRADLAGKAVCKARLQEQCGLPRSRDAVIGMVTRLTDQKGIDLLAEVLDQVLELDLQLVILGSGQPQYHEMLEKARKARPDKVHVTLGFNNKLAHEIEAGSDIFLMPSRFEPCGLNQMYSLKYGTVPIVRRTGGLADTVVDYTPGRLKAGKANGFSFSEYRGSELLKNIKRALKTYGDRREWNRLMRVGMGQDFSWSKSASSYAALYEKIQAAAV